MSRDDFVLWWFVMLVTALPAIPMVSAMVVTKMPVIVWRRRTAEKLLEEAVGMAEASGESESAYRWWENRVGAFSVRWVITLGAVNAIFDAGWRGECAIRGWPYRPLASIEPNHPSG